MRQVIAVLIILALGWQAAPGQSYSLYNSVVTSRKLPERQFQPAPPLARLSVTQRPLGTLPVDPTDPFAENSPGYLGQVIVEASAEESMADSGDYDLLVPAGQGDPFADDDAFGAGVATDNQSGDFGNFDDGGFGEADDFNSNSNASGSNQKKSGLFGSVIKAFTRSALPTKAIENVANQGRAFVPGAGGPAGGMDNGSGFEQDGFSESGFDNSAEFSGNDSFGANDGFGSEDAADFGNDGGFSSDDSNPSEGPDMFGGDDAQGFDNADNPATSNADNSSSEEDEFFNFEDADSNDTESSDEAFDFGF